MQFKRESFHVPRKAWLWVLIPIWITLLIASLYQFGNLFESNQPNTSAKYLFLLFFGLCLLVTYLLMGYMYLRWATPLKNKLIDLSYSDHRVLIYRYDRYFVNEALLQKEQIAEKPYTRLSQRDLKDVATRIELESR